MSYFSGSYAPGATRIKRQFARQSAENRRPEARRAFFERLNQHLAADGSPYRFVCVDDEPPTVVNR